MNYELMIGEKELILLFFNTFAADNCILFVQQKQYHKMMMDELVEFFLICHSTDQLLCQQYTHEARKM